VKIFRPLLIASLVFSLAALAGCNKAAADAFVVNGHATSNADFNDELKALADNDAFVEGLKSNGFEVPKNGDALPASVSALWATFVVESEIVADAVRKQKIEVTDANRTQAQADAEQFFGSKATLEKFPKWFRDRVKDRLAERNAFITANTKTPTPEEVQAFFDRNKAQIVAGCASGKFVSHILVATEQEALDVVDALDAGTPFEQLAQERSADTQSAAIGGFLDCFQAGTYGAEFDAAVTALAPFSTSAPVQTQAGYHVIRVLAEPTFESLRAQIEQQLGQATVQDAILKLRKDAKVNVDPRYGKWVVDDQGARVEPPKAKVQPSTTSAPPATGVFPGGGVEPQTQG
jgi:hypothetical protein